MSEELFAKLRRLRREGPPPAPAPPPDAEPPPRAAADAAPPLPASLRRRLAGDAGRAAGAPGPAARALALGLPERLRDERTAAGAFAVRVEERAAAARHGALALEEALAVAPDAFAELARDASLARVDLARAVYLDVETTGLAGGAGTTSFLVALGTFEPAAGGGRRFVVRQGFLREPGEERALLADVAERVRAAGALVSFFGKSFDRHRLEDKMRVHGVAPPFDGVPHLDLYHPCARLYRAALADGRLATMERALCGVEREDDLPGSRAPEAWFDYLAGRAHRLEAVFRHNLLDVLSLVTLAAHVGRAREEAHADGRPLGGPAWARAAGIARLLADRGRRAEALVWLDRALERAPGAAARTLALARLELALGLVPRGRRGDGERARAAEACAALAAGAEDELTARALVLRARLLRRAGAAAAAARACARARRVLAQAVTGRPRARLERELDRVERELGRNERELGRIERELGRNERELGRNERELGRIDPEPAPGGSGDPAPR